MVMYYVDLIEKWSHYNPGQPRDNNGRWRAYKYNFVNGRKLSGHFKKHGAEFGHITKEQYIRLTNKLLSTKPDGDTIGFDISGVKVRYRRSDNTFAKSVNGIIKTCFRPNNKEKYYENEKKKYT